MVIAAVFSQDLHDTKLELERMKELNVKALLIQKVLRGYKYRCNINGSKTVLFRFVQVFASSLCGFHLLKERIPKEKGSCACHSEALERT